MTAHNLSVRLRVDVRACAVTDRAYSDLFHAIGHRIVCPLQDSEFNASRAILILYD
jgi:hypothetical protein